jgi:hypothetical protein
MKYIQDNAAHDRVWMSEALSTIRKRLRHLQSYAMVLTGDAQIAT